jgi:uncharacterized protein (TIGR02231 family)
MLLDSQIYGVTVFSDRALIERTAKVSLAAGEHSLVFGRLPVGLDTNSIQVGGGQKCILLEIKAKDVHLNEIPDEQKKELHHEIEQLEFKIEELNDKVEIFRQEKELLQKLTELSSDTPKKGLFPILVPDKVNEILSFYSGKMTQIDQDLRLNNRELVKLNEQLNKLKQQANLYNNASLKTEKQVEIKLFTEEDTEHILILSYVVMNASWRPIYDLRLNSEEKKFVVGYNAIITQKTGEKWENVKLKLSTAKPQISASQPRLSAWFIDVFYPAPPSPKMKKEQSYRSAMPMSMKSMSVSDEVDKFMEAEEAPMPVLEAKIETGASAVNFAIQGIHSVNDNNEKHKVAISNLNFDAILDYNAVPKFSPYAYLTATSTNNSEFPMLAGDANIFLDNNFVANSNLKLVAPNQEFKISLGIDEGVQIEYKLVNKFSKDEGLFSKKNKIVFEYKIEIKNNKKIDCLIKIKDQIPVSQNQDIKVELLDPKYKEDSPNLKKTDDGIIEWNQKINPGEKFQIGLKFSVEYPREIEVTGLE